MKPVLMKVDDDPQVLMTIERDLGGQAGTSSKIENYLGLFGSDGRQSC